jgi:hypothetical protein
MLSELIQQYLGCFSYRDGYSNFNTPSIGMRIRREKVHSLIFIHIFDLYNLTASNISISIAIKVQHKYGFHSVVFFMYIIIDCSVQPTARLLRQVRTEF